MIYNQFPIKCSNSKHLQQSKGQCIDNDNESFYRFEEKKQHINSQVKGQKGKRMLQNFK